MAVNTEFPYPQADRLNKVAVVIDAVGAGADTTAAIAQALDMVDRQGAYYASAAGYLGLLEQLDTNPKTFALTDAGQQMLQAGADVRADLILQAVADVPEVGLLLDKSLAAVREHYAAAGLDAVTASRRANTIASWAATVTGPGLSAELTAVDVAHVTAAAATIRDRVRKARSVPAPAVCSRCYLQLSTGSNQCQNC